MGRRKKEVVEIVDTQVDEVVDAQVDEVVATEAVTEPVVKKRPRKVVEPEVPAKPVLLDADIKGLFNYPHEIKDINIPPTEMHLKLHGCVIELLQSYEDQDIYDLKSTEATEQILSVLWVALQSIKDVGMLNTLISEMTDLLDDGHTGIEHPLAHWIKHIRNSTRYMMSCGEEAVDNFVYRVALFTTKLAISRGIDVYGAFHEMVRVSKGKIDSNIDFSKYI